MASDNKIRTIFAVGLVRLAAMASPLIAADTQAIDAWGRTPILEEGRIKPADTVARVALMRLGGKTYVKNGQERISAQAWYYRLATGDRSVDSLPVFRVDHPDLKTLLGGTLAQKMYSYNDMIAVLPTLAQAATDINPDPKKRDSYEKQLDTLINNMALYYDLRHSWGPGGVFYNQTLELTPAIKTRVAYEYYFNQINPILWAEVGYALAFIALLVGAVFARGGKNSWVVVGLLAISLILHTFGLVSRMYIQERPPVTNLYSSAIFIGLIAVAGAMALERALKNGLGYALAAIVGFGTIQIADKLAESGDTLEVMRAVLNSNFWLSTHVIVVTIGYSAMFIAGGLAALILLKKAIGRTTPEEIKHNSVVVYGVVCAALLFSFVGTMLGGVWADQSWGRFWGWDPKENGALMIVLWAALILHARWGRMVGDIGILCLAVAGNIITAWSWFGTNLLGVGLHSYGFTEGGFVALIGFVLSQLIIITAGIFFGLKGTNK